MDSLKESLNSICRLCLTKVDDPSTMESLEDEEADSVWTASVRSFTLKKPMVSDSLPNKMCSYCAVWITKLIHFKLQCQVSERLLTSLLKYYKEEMDKASAIVTVAGQQWNVPVQDTRELLSKYDNHLNKLHKAVQYTVAHLDKRAVEGNPVLPYRTVNTVQFYLTFIQHLLLSVNSVICGDSQGPMRNQMPDMSKEQTWDRSLLPRWAQEILNHSYGQLWDRFIQATCASLGSKQNNCGGASSSQQQISVPTCNSSVKPVESSGFPVLQSVLSNSKKESQCQYSKKPKTCNATPQMAASSSVPLVVNLDEETPDPLVVTLEEETLPVSKSDQLKQKTISTQKVKQYSSKQGTEGIHILQKSAGTTAHTVKIHPSNILAQQKSQQQVPPPELPEFQTAAKTSEGSMPQRQLTSSTQNTKSSQEVQSKNSKSQADTQRSKLAEISVQLEPMQNNNLETTQSVQIFSEVHELLMSTSVQESSADQTLQSVQSSTLQELVENAQELPHSIDRLIGSGCLKRRAVEHSSLLGNDNLAEKKTPESEARKTVQCSHSVAMKPQQVAGTIKIISEHVQKQTKTTAESQTTTNGKESQEPTNKHSELPKEGEKQQESQGVIKKVSECRETTRETLGLQENRVKEQTKTTGLKEQTNQAADVLKQSNTNYESRGQLSRTNESQASETQQTESNQSHKQLPESSTSSVQAMEEDKSVQQQIPEADSSSGQEATNEQAHQESSTKTAKQPGQQAKDKQQFFELLLKKAISRAYERKKAVPATLKRRERVRSFEEPASLELQNEVRVKKEPTEVTDDKISRPSSAPNAGVFDELPPLVPIPKSNFPSIASVACMSKAKERSINSEKGKEIPSSISKSMDNGTKDKTVSTENTVPSSLQSSQQPSMVDTRMSEALNAQTNSELMQNRTDNSALKNSVSTTQSVARNEESRKSSEETNIPKNPVVTTKGLIRVRQDLATDPATRISSHNSKQAEPSNSFAVQQSQQQKQTNTSNLAQPIPVISDLQKSVASQQHTSQLRVPVSGNTSFTAASSQPTGLPYVQHSYMPSLISGSISNQKQMYPVLNIPISQQQQQWMIRHAPPYQLGSVATMPNPSITNVSQALPTSVITTVFQNSNPTPPYPLPLPTSQAAQSGVNSFVTSVQSTSANAPVKEDDSAAMSRLYQKHLGITVPQSEHFKEPYISQLVSKLQLLQQGSHYPPGRAHVHGVPHQKNTAGVAEQPQQVDSTSATRTSESHISQTRASVPVSQQNIQYNGTVPVSQQQNIIPVQQIQSGTGVPLFSLSSMNRMAVLQQQQQARSRVNNMPTSSQQTYPSGHAVQHHSQTLGTPATVSQQLILPKGNELPSQQPTVITSVALQPQNVVPVSQHHKVQTEANSSNKNNNHLSVSQKASKTGNNQSVLQHQKVQAGSGLSAPQQSWGRILVPQHPSAPAGTGAYTSHFVMTPRMGVPLLQSQNLQVAISTTVPQSTAQLNTSITAPGYQKQAKLITTIPQSAMQSTNTVASWHHQKQLLGALLTGQVVPSNRSAPVGIQKAQPVAQQGNRTKESTSGIQAANVTAASQSNTTHFTNSTQQAKHIYTSAVSKAMLLSKQSSTITSNRTCPPQGQLVAVRECIGALVQHEVNRVCEPRIVPPNQTIRNVPSASNQSNKQQYLSVASQCNRTSLGSKQQNLSTAGQLPGSASSASAKSVGHQVGNIQRQSETGQRVLFQNEVLVDHISGARNATPQNSGTHNSFSKKDQPGVNVLPEVVRAIGSELGVFMEEDAVESVYRISPRKSIIIPQPSFLQGRQKSKSSTPRSARLLAQSVKMNLITLMKENSREQLGLSEQKWQKLQAATLDHSVFRSSNWKLIKPPGVKIRRYVNRRKSEQSKAAVANVAEQQLVENVPTGDVLQPEVVSSLAESADNTGQADNPEKFCDFRIKITKNNGTYESSAVDHSAIKDSYVMSEFDSDSSDSWELYVPRAAKRRRVIYDDDDDDDDASYHDDDDDDKNQEDEKPSIKVSQLHAYQLAPYVTMTKLHPEFFEPGNLYDLNDPKVAAMAQRLSMVVRKPGTIGRTVKQELQQ